MNRKALYNLCNIWVQSLELRIRHSLLMLKNQHRLYQTRHTSCGFQVPDIRLDCSYHQRMISISSSTEDIHRSFNLDGVA